jgi:hypothetical protein
MPGRRLAFGPRPVGDRIHVMPQLDVRQGRKIGANRWQRNSARAVIQTHTKIAKSDGA